MNREIVLNAINRKKQDVFPSHIEFTPEMGEKIANHLGVNISELQDIVNHYIRIEYANDTKTEDHKNGIRFDNFGIGWDLVITEGFFVRYYPLKNIKLYKTYQFPDPNEPQLNKNIEETIIKNKNKFFIISNHSFALWERAYCLRGFENFLFDMVENKKFAEELLDRITEYQVQLAKRYVVCGVDGGLTGDDWGQQRGLLFSPKLWRALIKPRIAKIWNVYKDAGLSVFHHTCGDVREIIPDLIEIGLDVLNPIQPQAMPIEELSKNYANDLSFWGGLSLQKTLPFGSVDEVQKEVENTVKILGVKGGYIISPAHELTSDIPLENFDAMMKTIRKFSK